MLTRACANVAEAGGTNEVNLTADKTAVITEMYRNLEPGGRLGISDVVAEDHLSEQDSFQRGSYEGCIAGW